RRAQLVRPQVLLWLGVHGSELDRVAGDRRAAQPVLRHRAQPERRALRVGDGASRARRRSGLGQRGPDRRRRPAAARSLRTGVLAGHRRRDADGLTRRPLRDSTMKSAHFTAGYVTPSLEAASRLIGKHIVHFERLTALAPEPPAALDYGSLLIECDD